MRRKIVRPLRVGLFLNLPAGHSSRYVGLLCDAMPKKLQLANNTGEPIIMTF